MYRRIHFNLIVQDITTQEQLINLINNKITQLNVYNIDKSVSVTNTLDNKIIIGAELRLKNNADADDLKNFIQDKWQTGNLANKLLTGSKISLHNCSHDDPKTKSCTEDVVLIKGV